MYLIVCCNIYKYNSISMCIITNKYYSNEQCFITIKSLYFTHKQ